MAYRHGFQQRLDDTAVDERYHEHHGRQGGIARTGVTHALLLAEMEQARGMERTDDPVGQEEHGEHGVRPAD